MTIAVSTKLVQTSVKACATMPKGSLGKKPINCNESSSIHYASTVQRRFETVGNMDSELSLQFIGYFPDYFSAVSRRLLRFFFFLRFVLWKQLHVPKIPYASWRHFYIKNYKVHNGVTKVTKVC